MTGGQGDNGYVGSLYSSCRRQRLVEELRIDSSGSCRRRRSMDECLAGLCMSLPDRSWTILVVTYGLLHAVAFALFFSREWIVVPIGRYMLSLGVWGYCLNINDHEQCRLFYHLTPWEAQSNAVRLFQVGQSVFMGVCYVTGLLLFLTRNMQRTFLSTCKKLCLIGLDAVHFTANTMCLTGVLLYHVEFLKVRPSAQNQRNDFLLHFQRHAWAGYALIITTVIYSFAFLGGFIVVVGRKTYLDSMVFRKQSLISSRLASGAFSRSRPEDSAVAVYENVDLVVGVRSSGSHHKDVPASCYENVLAKQDCQKPVAGALVFKSHLENVSLMRSVQYEDSVASVFRSHHKSGSSMQNGQDEDSGAH